MAETFPYQGLHFVLLRRTREGATVELWMPPAGIWGRLGAPEVHATAEAAQAHASRYALSAQVPYIVGTHLDLIR